MRWTLALWLCLSVGGWTQAPYFGPAQSAPHPPRSARDLRMPDLRGCTQEEARARLEQAGIRYQIAPVVSSAPRHSIIAQRPEPGTPLAGQALLYLADVGPPPVARPTPRPRSRLPGRVLFALAQVVVLALAYRLWKTR